jgi:hypothetical protein
VPEPITCHKSAGSPAIQCDPVLIGPESDAPPATEVQTSEAEHGAQCLVDVHAPTLRVRKEEKVRFEAPSPATELARDCGVKALSTVLAVTNVQGQGPMTVGLNVLRAVVELEQCVQTTLERVALRAQQEHALEICEKNGGEPVGFVLETLTCEVPPDHPIR